MYCSQCGAEVKPEENFCGSCGAVLKKSNPPEPAGIRLIRFLRSGKLWTVLACVFCAALLVTTICVMRADSSAPDSDRASSRRQEDDEDEEEEDDDKTRLKGDDRVVYELIYEASFCFKDPSSVRVQSGHFGYDEEEDEYYGWFAISAKNGYGARSTGYYYVGYLDGEIFAADLEDENIYSSDLDFRWAKETDNFDADAVNEALAQRWKNYE